MYRPGSLIILKQTKVVLKVSLTQMCFLFVKIFPKFVLESCRHSPWNLDIRIAMQTVALSTQYL